MEADVLVERTALQRTQRVAVLVLAFLFLVLLVSGVWLAFRYQPSSSFPGVKPRPESWLRVAHRVGSIIFVVAALLTFGISIAVSFERRLRAGIPAWVVGFVLFLGAVTTAISGYLLPWDQLALKAVKANTEYRGFGFLFGGSDVRFALLGSAEISLGSMRQAFIFHAAVFPLSLLIVGGVLWQVTRRTRLRPPEPASPPEPEPDAETPAAPPS